MCEKNNFSELEKLFFRKASVFFKLLGKQCSRSPRPSTSILRGLEAVQACAKKNHFSELEKLFFPQSLSFLQVIGEYNVSGPHVYPHIDFAWIGSSPSMCEKTIFRSLKTCFSAKPRLHPIRPFIRGHATQKMNRKGELQTSRISSNLRIWQSFSRVPQNLKVLCVWYS